MKYLCLICADTMMEQMTESEARKHLEEYSEFTKGIRRDGHFIAFPSEEAHGASVFHKDAAGNVFHTHSTYARGCDVLLGAYNWLDLTPKGRNESGPMDWVRHHDKYS